MTRIVERRVYVPVNPSIVTSLPSNTIKGIVGPEYLCSCSIHWKKVIKSVKCHFSIYSTSINCYVQCFTLHIKGVCWPRTLLIKTFKLLSISIPEFLQPITQFTYYAHVAFCLIMCHFLFYNFSFFFCQIVFHTVSDPLSHSSTCLLVGQNIS